jgi:quinol-cytochrome oxidoreductase complex cytochrome b subunit
VPAQVPLVGHLLSRILRGGSDVTGATLSRFYGIHVAILPAITTALLGAHLILVQRQGMSVPRSVEREGTPRSMSFVPDFLMRDMVGWLAAVGILAALSAFWPWELGVKADPFAPAPAGIRPEWFFLWMFQGLKYLPATVLGIPGETLGILLLGGIGAVFLAMPILDRRLSRWWNFAAVLLLIGMAVLTVLALVPVKAHA